MKENLEVRKELFDNVFRDWFQKKFNVSVDKAEEEHVSQMYECWLTARQDKLIKEFLRKIFADSGIATLIDELEAHASGYKVSTLCDRLREELGIE